MKYLFNYSSILETYIAPLQEITTRRRTQSSHGQRRRTILSYPILSYPILSYPILSCPILSYPILSYPILSYPILFYPILSYYVLFYSFLSNFILSNFILFYAYSTSSHSIFTYPILSNISHSI